MATPLQSGLFQGDNALQAAADRDSGHIVPGSSGEHVAKIQAALLLLTAKSIARSEFLGGIYGPTTATAVQSYKDERGIINFSYQKAADNIVGKMTIAALDQELEADVPSRLLCAPTERPRIDSLLISLRPGVLRMIDTTLASLADCQQGFALTIVNPFESNRLLNKNALTVDGLQRFFSIDSSNQNVFLPRVIANYSNYRSAFPRLPATQRGVGFVEFLKRFRANLVPPGANLVKGGELITNLPVAISSSSDGAMFFTPRYRLFNVAEPLSIRGLFAQTLTGIQLHEMGHFFFNFVDGDPRGQGPVVGLRTAGSYDIVARQATFGTRIP